MDKVNVEKVETENQLHFKWTKHLFLLANFLIILEIAISWIIYNKGINQADVSNPLFNSTIPFMVITPIAIGVWFICYYFNNKDIPFIKSNINKKYINLYFISNILFFCLILLSTILYIVFSQILVRSEIISYQNGYIITFVISAVFSVAVVTINKISLYKMEYEIYKKRYGDKEKNKDKKV